MTRAAQSGRVSPVSSWAALGETDLRSHAALLLYHVAKLLAVFVHVIEGRELESRETRVRHVFSSLGVVMSLSPTACSRSVLQEAS